MNRSGATLVEVVVAVTLAGVGVTGVASLTAAAMRTLTRARALDESYTVLTEFVDSARHVSGPDRGEREHPLGLLRWRLVASPGESRAQFDHMVLDDSVAIHFTVASALTRRTTP